MRAQDVVVGESYRFKTHPRYSYAKALKVIAGKTGVNPHNYKIVECLHTVYKNEEVGQTRYVRPCDLVVDT